MERLKIGNSSLELIKGDITQQDTEAIVNAANKQLATGGGVAGAIHRAAGPGLWEECRTIGVCETGEAKLSSGHNLKAKFIIHTVGPIYSGKAKDVEDLRSCYINSLILAEKNRITSISFPSISTGAFGYPFLEAAEISLRTVKKYLEGNTIIKLVRFVLFSQTAYDVYSKTIRLLNK